MDSFEKGDVGVSTIRKGEGDAMNSDERRLAEMGAHRKHADSDFRADDAKAIHKSWNGIFRPCRSSVSHPQPPFPGRDWA